MFANFHARVPIAQLCHVWLLRRALPAGQNAEHARLALLALAVAIPVAGPGANKRTVCHGDSQAMPSVLCCHLIHLLHGQHLASNLFGCVVLERPGVGRRNTDGSTLADQACHRIVVRDLTGRSPVRLGKPRVAGDRVRIEQHPLHMAAGCRLQHHLDQQRLPTA